MIDNRKVTNIPCRLHNVGEGGVAGADEVIDDLKGKTQQQINAEVEQTLGNGGSVDERIAAAVAPKANSNDVYAKTETYNKTELNNMITTPEQGFVTVTATDETTDVTDVLPATGAADTTYRVGNWDGTQYNDSVFSEYAWNGSAYIKLSTKSQVGEVYDISANHAGATYADLAAALGTNGANIPQSLRKGGMSVKFVQTTDNKYVQARLMSDTFSTDVANWQGVDDEPTAGSQNLVKSGGVHNCYNDTKSIVVGDGELVIYNADFFNFTSVNCKYGTSIKAKVTGVSDITLMMEYYDADGQKLSPRKFFYLNDDNNFEYESEVPEGAATLMRSAAEHANLILKEVYLNALNVTKNIKELNTNLSSVSSRTEANEIEIDKIKNAEYIEIYNGAFNDLTGNCPVIVNTEIKVKATVSDTTLNLMVEFIDANGTVLSPREYFYLNSSNNFENTVVVPVGASNLKRATAHNNVTISVESKTAVSLQTLKKDIEETNRKIEDIENPLSGKKLYFAGDSIGAGYEEDGEIINWAKLIADKNNMTLTNASRGGSTIRYKNASTGCVRQMLESIQGDYDYIIFEGGVNDGAADVGVFQKPYDNFFDFPLYDETVTYEEGDIIRKDNGLFRCRADMTEPAGTWDKTKWENHLIQKQYPALSTLDLTKTYSAMEYCCKYLMMNYPTKKYGFIVTYRGESYDSWNALSDNLIAICEKYGMPYIDLRKIGGFNIIDPELMDVYSKETELQAYDENASYVVDDQITYNGAKYKALVNIPSPAGQFDATKWTYIGNMDGWHCNGLGYRQSVSKIEAWMKTL